MQISMTRRPAETLGTTSNGIMYELHEYHCVVILCTPRVLEADHRTLCGAIKTPPRCEGPAFGDGTRLTAHLYIR